MTALAALAGLLFFALGYFFGREAGKAPGTSACPRCKRKRFHYCASCGTHYDEHDEAVPPQGHPGLHEVPSGNRAPSRD